MEAQKQVASLRTTGISEECMRAMCAVFRQYPWIESVRLYGSRAQGSFHEDSDINLALVGEHKGDQGQLVTHALKALGAPYVFDVRAYADIHYPSLREHIDHDGMEIFRADPRSIGQGVGYQVIPVLKKTSGRLFPWGKVAGVCTFVALLIFDEHPVGETVAMSYFFGWLAMLIPLVKPTVLGLAVGVIVGTISGAVRFFRDGSE